MAPKYGIEDIVWSALGALFGYKPDPGCPAFDGKSRLNDAYWSGDGSQNIPKSAEAYRLVKAVQSKMGTGLYEIETNIAKIFANERTKGFMTTELLSYIYEDAHVTFAAIVALFSTSLDNRQAALDWLATWSYIVDRLTLNERSPGPGMRGAGHDQSPGKRELMRSWMASDVGRQKRAEALCKQSKLAPRQKWWYAVGKATLPKLNVQPKLVFTKFIKPLYVAHGKDSITAWIEPGDGEWSNANGNTGPVLVSQIGSNGTRFLPANGGVRVREQFDHAKATRVGQSIVYTSDQQTAGQLVLPNDVVIERIDID